MSMKKTHAAIPFAVALGATLFLSACQAVESAPLNGDQLPSQEATEPSGVEDQSPAATLPSGADMCAAITSAGMGDAVGGPLTILEPSEAASTSACAGYVDDSRVSGIAMGAQTVDGPAVVAQLQDYPADQLDTNLGDGAWAPPGTGLIVMVSGDTQVSMNILATSGTSIDSELAMARFIAFLDAVGIAH